MAPTGQMKTFRVLGIDPGLTVTGYAVVQTAAPVPGHRACLSGSGGVQLQEAGVIRPVADESLESRLEQIFLSISDVLDDYQPDVVAVEDLHANLRHPRTAILMAHARGVVYLAAGLRGITVRAFAPTLVKQVVTGSGRASKAQVRTALCQQLGLDRLPDPHDLSDAIAVAVCGTVGNERLAVRTNGFSLPAEQVAIR